MAGPETSELELARHCADARGFATRIAEMNNLVVPKVNCRWITSDESKKLERELNVPFNNRHPLRASQLDAIYSALGMPPKGKTSDELQIDLSATEGIAIVDYATASLNINRDNMRKLAENVRTQIKMHESAHLVQHRNFSNLRVASLPIALELDDRAIEARNARSSFCEGDADLMIPRLLFPNNESALGNSVYRFLESRKEEIETKASKKDGLDKFQYRTMVYAYADGLAYAYFHRGRLNELRRNPPKTMAEILHPEKKISMIPPNFSRPDLRPETTMRFGESDLGIYLAQWSPITEARQAATGWTGDQLRLFGPNNSRVRWGIRFETAEQSERFFNQLVKSWSVRFRSAPTPVQKAKEWTADGYVTKLWVSGNQVDVEILKKTTK